MKKDEKTQKNDQTLAKMLEEIEREKQAKMRAIADLENFRRRENENQKRNAEFSVAVFLTEVLPNFSELDRALVHLADSDEKVLISKLFAALQKSGLEKINPQKGEKVDPNFHSVLATASGNAGEITEVLAPGWKFGSIVLEPAKVAAAPI